MVINGDRKPFDWMGAVRIILGMLIIPLLIMEVRVQIRMAECEQWIEFDTERNSKIEEQFKLHVTKQEIDLKDLMNKLDHIRSSQDQMIGRLGTIVNKLGE